MKHSISFYTLGCKVNQSDTASMEKLFREAGYEIVPFGEASDICLINTCVVTNMGQGKSRRMIRRTIKRDPKPLIVVTGCYPQTAPEEVAALEGVDLLVGNRDRARIVELVEERLGERDAAPVNDVLDLPVGSEFEDLAASVDDSRDRAFLKIQEGCDQYCSYCIIPMQEVICVPDRYQVSAAKWSTLQKKGIRKSFSLVSILAVMVRRRQMASVSPMPLALSFLYRPCAVCA